MKTRRRLSDADHGSLDEFPKSKHYTDFGPMRLMKDAGMCSKCNTRNSLLMDVDEFGVHGLICKSCGNEKVF